MCMYVCVFICAFCIKGVRFYLAPQEPIFILLGVILPLLKMHILDLQLCQINRPAFKINIRLSESGILELVGDSCWGWVACLLMSEPGRKYMRDSQRLIAMRKPGIRASAWFPPLSDSVYERIIMSTYQTKNEWKGISCWVINDSGLSGHI